MGSGSTGYGFTRWMSNSGTPGLPNWRGKRWRSFKLWSTRIGPIASASPINSWETCWQSLASSVSGAKLEQLLDASIVAEVELPEQPVFDAVAAARATPRDFPAPPAPPEDGPRVCILDSGIVSNHPLLAANVGA